MENKNPLSRAQRASVEAGNFEALSTPYHPRIQANAVMQARLRWILRLEAQHG